MIPLMAVVNYSVQETFGNNVFFFEGVKWFEQVLHLGALPCRAGAPARSSPASSWLIEIPLGVAIALTMPRRGIVGLGLSGADGAAAADPVERGRRDLEHLRPADIGLLGHTLDGARLRLQLHPASARRLGRPSSLMDVWHWTSLVVLLAYAGLSAIPDAYYQAAKIDGASRWAVFRYIQLPKMKRVLTIAILLRFMDCFMIYTEPFVLTGGGPGNATTFLSIDLVKIALGQFDLGPAAAMSIIYFLIILLVSWIFYTLMMRQRGGT